MSAVTAQRIDESCCLVVSIGVEANVALGTVRRAEHRGWYAVAIGQGAADARADGVIETDDEDDTRIESVLAALADTWPDIDFVYVVFDQHDDDTRALACAILEAARRPTRLLLAFLLGRTFACHSEPLRDLCDCLLRLADDRAPGELGAAIEAVLSPFVALWLPIKLDVVEQLLRDASDVQVLALRSTSAFAPALTSLIDPIGRPPHFIHLLHGDGAVRMMEVGEFWSPEDLSSTECSVGIADELASNELLVAIVAPLGARGDASRSNYLRMIVGDRAAELLARDGRSAHYRTRLRKELDWWAARDQRTETLLELAVAVDGVRARNGALGPSLRNPGGSLVAHLLGLSVFDPVEWELSFEEFVNGRDMVALEAVVSERVVAEHELPYFPRVADGEPRPATFVADPRLEHVGYVDDWRRILDERRPALGSYAARHAIGLESDIDLVPGIAAITQCSAGRLLYDHQITAVLSQLMIVSYPKADRVRHQLAKGGAFADEATARLLRLATHRGADASNAAIVERLRQRALPSIPRSIALNDALIELARRRATGGR